MPIEERLERVLSPYGHFVALEGQAADSQPFAIAEIAVLVGPTVLWAAKEIAGMLLRNWGEGTAERFTRWLKVRTGDADALRERAERLRDELESVLATLADGEPVDRELLERARSLSVGLPSGAAAGVSFRDGDFDQLVAVFRSAGLPARAAANAAEQVVADLEDAGSA